jgi:hypothetical protein
MAQQEPRAAGDYETVLFEVKDNVASVTLNRPEAMNAFNRTMLNEFRQIWERVPRRRRHPRRGAARRGGTCLLHRPGREGRAGRP